MPGEPQLGHANLKLTLAHARGTTTWAPQIWTDAYPHSVFNCSYCAWPDTHHLDVAPTWCRGTTTLARPHTAGCPCASAPTSRRSHQMCRQGASPAHQETDALVGLFGGTRPWMKKEEVRAQSW